MLLAYVDESYSDVHYWIAALLCSESEAIPLTTALDTAVAKAASSYAGVNPRAELHGYPLFHGEGEWEPLKSMPRARIGIYNDALTAIAASGATIILRGVNILRLNARYRYPDHPHAVALGHLLERIDERAEELGELVLVIADEVDEAAQYRRNLWHYQRFATSGYRARQLTRIVDTIHFAPSHASRLVQAADLVAYLWRRISSGVDIDKRAIQANNALWNRLAGRVSHVSCWDP